MILIKIPYNIFDSQPYIIISNKLKNIDVINDHYKKLLFKNMEEYEKRNEDVKIYNNNIFLKRFMLIILHNLKILYNDNDLKIDKLIIKRLSRKIQKDFKRVGENNLDKTIKITNLINSSINPIVYNPIYRLLNNFKSIRDETEYDIKNSKEKCYHIESIDVDFYDISSRVNDLEKTVDKRIKEIDNALNHLDDKLLEESRYDKKFYDEVKNKLRISTYKYD